MQDVNPDMDEIFKKAADKYPLKTNTAQWEAMSERLQGLGAKSGIGYNKRTLALLFLVLLIPTGLIITQYLKAHKEETIVRIEDNQVKSLPREKAGNINKGEAANQGNSEIYANKNKAVSQEEYNAERRNNVPVELNDSKAKNQKEWREPLLQHNEIELYDNPNKIYLPGNVNDDIIKGKPTMFFESGTAERKSGNSKNNTQLDSKLKRFYIGGVIGPELISVKFQPVKRTSFNLGILIGYRLTNKIGLELGATFAHKYYYTDGKYTTPKSIRFDNSKILNVDAFSSITEMPLTLQYNIKNKKRYKSFCKCRLCFLRYA